VIRLVIADDHPIVREGLHRIVAEHPDMSVVGEAADGDRLQELLQDLTADVLLLDISMPGLPFLEMMQHLRTTFPRLRVLVVSAHPEDQYALRSLRAGAAGYLTKNHTPDELAEAIRRVHQGARFVTSTLAEALAFELDPEYDRPLHDRLSEREYQVLVSLGAGRSLKEIAAEMALSPKTVSTYRARVLNKLGLKTTAELIRYAIEQRLTD
jgi:DNA-binding NarL/FixJ family response regulator